MSYFSQGQHSQQQQQQHSWQQPATIATPQHPQLAPVVLTSTILESFKVTKIFKDNTQIITSLDFDDSGTKCITSAEDESLHVYDCTAGKLHKTLFSKKYGVHLARFTHRSTNVVYASTKEDDTLRYLSLHDNRYIRYFKGHEKKVVALEMSPLDDQFIAGSEDAVRLWDLRSPNCQGAVSIVGRPAVAFDPSGLVFAVALDATLRLYDVKSFDQGPFQTAEIGSSLGIHSQNIRATQLEFSTDGKNILVTTSGDAHYVIDAYSVETKFKLTGHSYGTDPSDTFPSGGEASWTPDGKCVLSGSRDGWIYLWDIARASQEPMNVLNSNGASGSNGTLVGPNRELSPFKVLKAHSTPSHIVGFNPKYLMMVSGSTELAFWEPDPNIVGLDALHDFSSGVRH
ncbi:member of Set1p complex, histone methyl transferase [Actinomortierella ambigua]|uniref:Member of Set1p complex, histone methyl transferase n=1 Tax=Actinomortierella ambigua TaxID=1343610 RepID=A0A9P6PR77_9FUNG|nr:member of Set1p complex, histone methyl transferase [Actinomortierella ambigua]KAG0250986.1 member of Set1p complex, histone methyl transferase [Actinomortierella ambigua]